MKIISFAWTTPPLLADAKHCTRRSWDPSYARQFYQGLKCQGYDRNPRIHGSQVAVVKLTHDPLPQRTGWMTEEDYREEGLLWMEEHGLMVHGQPPRRFFEEWKAANEPVYLIRFSLQEVLEPLDKWLQRNNMRQIIDGD